LKCFITLEVHCYFIRQEDVLHFLHGGEFLLAGVCLQRTALDAN